jgi:hypothetical protein
VLFLFCIATSDQTRTRTFRLKKTSARDCLDGACAGCGFRRSLIVSNRSDPAHPVCGTTLMNVGLILTPVSIYQMSRGALVLWVGILSVLFLGRRLWLYQWTALVIVTLGVCLVGLSGSLVKSAVGSFTSEDPAKVALGVALILFAQTFTATQYVVEEKIMSRYRVEPLVSLRARPDAHSRPPLLWRASLASSPLLLQCHCYTSFFDTNRHTLTSLAVGIRSHPTPLSSGPLWPSASALEASTSLALA